MYTLSMFFVLPVRLISKVAPFNEIDQDRLVRQVGNCVQLYGKKKHIFILFLDITYIGLLVRQSLKDN